MCAGLLFSTVDTWEIIAVRCFHEDWRPPFKGLTSQISHTKFDLTCSHLTWFCTSDGCCFYTSVLIRTVDLMYHCRQNKANVPSWGSILLVTFTKIVLCCVVKYLLFDYKIIQKLIKLLVCCSLPVMCSLLIYLEIEIPYTCLYPYPILLNLSGI